MDTTFTPTCARWIHPAAIGFWSRSRPRRPNGLQSGTGLVAPARADRAPYARGGLRLKLSQRGVVAQLGERRVHNTSNSRDGGGVEEDRTPDLRVNLTYCGPSPH